MGIETVSTGGGVSDYEETILFQSASPSPQTNADVPFVNDNDNDNFTRAAYKVYNNNDLQFNKSLSLSNGNIFGEVGSGSKTFQKYDDMKYWIIAAIGLIVLRKLVEKNIFQPLGKKLGIKDRNIKSIDKIPCRKPGAVKILEKIYSPGKGKLTDSQLKELSSQIGLEPREIERWMRRRRAQDRTSTLIKFSESGWRFVAYTVSTLIGIISLWDKPWFWDFKKCWTNYPNQELPDEIWWYYLYGAGLYTSFLFTQFMDVKRKDFWEMFLHHVITIGLLGCSFYLNLTRHGIIVLLLHDCADVFLESAKMANYAKYGNLSTGIFIGFILIWVVTRLWIYPTKIIYEAGWEIGYMGMRFPDGTALPIMVMLISLFGLHLFWTFFIGKAALGTLKSGPEKQKDSRSSGESSTDFSSDSNYEDDGSQEVTKPEMMSARLEKRLHGEEEQTRTIVGGGA